ncbi:hypothetical protein AAVH_11477 [Aphelenchoides avenae]|nr:hypothetical protein AAVH_11477 [Aphelenchus avenae]
MSPPVVLGFSLGDIGNSCNDCAARFLKEHLVRLINDACRERKEKGAMIITLTDMATGVTLESSGLDILDETEIWKMAREFVSHPRIRFHPFRPLVLIVHAFYRQ